jgi:hypothetical protein
VKKTSVILICGLLITHVTNSASETTINSVSTEAVQAPQATAPEQADIEHFESILATPDNTTLEPHIVITLQQGNPKINFFEIHIAYSSVEKKYSVFGVKPNVANTIGTYNIQKFATESVWEALEKWRTGIVQKLSGSYSQGTILLSIGGHPLWLWSETSFAEKLSEITIHALESPNQFMTVTKSATIPIVEKNSSRYVPFAANTHMLFTFKSATLPETFNCSLYKNVSEKAQYSLNFESKNNIQTTLTHRAQPTIKSNIPTSNGSYTVSPTIPVAPIQQYFIYYSPSKTGTLIALGILNDAGEPQTLLYWQNPVQDEPACTYLSLTSSVALDALAISSLPFTPPIPAPLGLIKENDVYTAAGLNLAAAYKNNSTEWAHSFAFPNTDDGEISFDINPLTPETVSDSGAVVLVGTQALGQPLYGVILEPETITRTRIRIFSLATGVPIYAPSSAILDGHTLGGRYHIAYKKVNSSQATITVNHSSGATKKLLTTLTLENVNSGICCATLSSKSRRIAYHNVSMLSSSSAGSQQTGGGIISLDALSVITRTAADPLDFNWNHSALQQVVDLTKGITLQTNVQWSPSQTGDKTIVVGLSPATVDPTKKYFFNDGIARFIGATQLVTITLKPTTIIFRQFLPTPEGTNSATASQSVIEKSVSEAACNLWISYAKQESTYTVSIGLNTPLGEAPLFSWNDTRTTGAADFAKIGLSSWTTALSYNSIKIAPYTPPVITTITTPAAPAVTAAPNSLIRTKTESKLEYLWALGKTAQNPNGIINQQHGGILTADVQITDRDALNTATIMIGLTSEINSILTARSSGVEIFKGAEYNIQIQSTPENGFVSLRRAVTSGDSPYDGADTVSPFKKLTEKTNPTGDWPVYKIWLRYTPRLTSRLFEIGLNDLTDSTKASDYTQPLWSYTESNVATTRKPLQYIGISSWNTGCIIKNIQIIATSAAPKTTTPELPADDGTITGTNLPQDGQWTTALITMRPNTIHKFATFGTETSRAVLAFSKTTTTPRSIGFRIVLTPQEAIVYEGTSTVPLVSSTNKQGSLSSDGASYWVQITNGTLSFGGYAQDGALIQAPYLTWSHDMLKGSNTWFATTGATSNASITYLNGTIIQSTATGTPALPAIIRTSAGSRLPQRPRPSAATTTSPRSSALLTSAELENQRYRINKKMPALPPAQRPAA